MIQSRLYSDIKKINGHDLSVRNTYTAGTDKGGVNAGDTFNGVYGLGQMTEDRMRYSSAAVSEIHKLTQKEAGEGAEKFITINGTGYNGFNLDWYPVVKVHDIVAKVVDSEGNTSDYPFKVVSSNRNTTVVPGTDEAVVREDGTVILGAVSSSAQVITTGREIKIRYLYNNIVA